MQDLSTTRGSSNPLPLGRLYFVGMDEVSGPPLSVLQGYDLLNHMIGENWFPGSTAQVVNYPASMGLLSGSQSAPGVDVGVAMGRASLDDQIKNAARDGDPVVIAALSEGTLVINRELAYLATDPSAPGPDLLSFTLFASPETGLFDIYLPAGAHLPVVNYTEQNLAESQYDVSVVFRQYDAWGDPPDRPWNLVAVANALFGMLYFHDGTATAGPSDVVEVSSVTSELGGTTTTYMVPSPTLPLLMPLEKLGFPKRIVGKLNGVLKPIVDAGYSRSTPDAGPYFSHGRLRRSPTATHADAKPAAAGASKVPVSGRATASDAPHLPPVRATAVASAEPKGRIDAKSPAFPPRLHPLAGGHYDCDCCFPRVTCAVCDDPDGSS